MATRYAASHHRLLTEAQTTAFIAALDHARTVQDVEKAVEQAINNLLVTGLSKAHPDSTITHDYRHSTDGYITVGESGSLAQPYALLVEAKRDLDFSGSRRDVATVLTQVCYYLRVLAHAGEMVPAVAVVCDMDEVFAIPAQRLIRYYQDDSFSWDEHSASDMYKDSALLAALIEDSNIQRPYVHDIAEGFDPDMFIWAVDAMGQGHEPQRVPVNSASMDHVFTRFKMEVLGTDATGLKNKDEIKLFIDVLRGDENVYPHPKKPNTLVVGLSHITLDTYRFEQFWSQYVVGDYTLAELKSLTEVADTLIEETDRRFTGDFWTPPRWVDKAHEYIEDALGEDWKDRFVVVDPACYDDQTEVYTQRGWILFKDLLDDDLIYSLNPFTLQGEWVGFVDRQVIPYDGTLLYIKSRRVDLVVTPDHKMFNAERPHIKKGHEVFPTRHFFWSAHDTAEYLRRGNRLQQVSAATCSGNKGTSTTRELNLARLMGLHIGDGSIQRNGSNNAVNSLVFSFAKQRKRDYLENLIEALDIDHFTYDEKPSNPAHNARKKYRLVSKWLLAEMEWFHDKKTHTKSFPPGVFDWPEDRKRALLEGLLESDGHKIKNGNLFVYSTVSPQLARDIERLAIELGYTTKQTNRRREYKGKVTRRQYEVSLLDKSPYKTIKKNHVSEGAYKGFVYDVTLEKNHILLVRRNGRSIFSGNCGTLNLTRDYRFSELYSSTLFQEELDIASDYNPEATKFQYDYLNDDMVLHDEDMTADKAVELARAGKLKLPLGLVEALAANKPVVFFANPPYGSNGNGTKTDGRKGGIAKTKVCELMNDLGHARQELYTQFIWRTKELAKVFGYTSDFHFFFFNKTFLTSPNFGKFVDNLTSELSYKDGFMMNAGEFSGTSSAWGIVFSHFEVGGTNQREFEYTVLESNKDLSISKLAEWTGRSVRRGETISDWFADVDLPREKQTDFPLTKNGFDAPTSKSVYLTPRVGAIGYLQNQSSNVQFSDKYTGVYSLGFSHAHGRDITRDNFTRAAVTFSIRRSVQEVIAAKKLLWVRDKDIFTRPPESLLTPEFIADCVIYSLFDRQSNQTSLRDYEYKGRTYRVVNEFFPFSHEEIVNLAQGHTNRTIESDAVGEGDRLMRRWLTEHDDDLSDQARALLNLAWDIYKQSFGKRATFDVINPRYQVQTWDAGWAQINAMVFGQNRVDDDMYDKFYAQWRSVRAALGDKIARAAMDAGVI